jgi:hypothetical protein
MRPFPGGKFVWSVELTSRFHRVLKLRCMDLYSHTYVFMALSSIKYRVFTYKFLHLAVYIIIILPEYVLTHKLASVYKQTFLVKIG